MDFKECINKTWICQKLLEEVYENCSNNIESGCVIPISTLELIISKLRISC